MSSEEREGAELYSGHVLIMAPLSAVPNEATCCNVERPAYRSRRRKPVAWVGGG